MDSERDTEKYLLDKLGAAKRIIHASIRMFWTNEDPLAINLLAQSADQLSSDLMGNGKDIIWDSPLIIENKKKELFKILRQTRNFVKHANNDRDGILKVFDLQCSAEIATFFSVLRIRELSGSLTCHMKLYLAYHHMRYPDHMTIEGQNLLSMLNEVDSTNPVQFRLMWGKAALLHPAYVAELEADTADSN